MVKVSKVKVDGPRRRSARLQPTEVAGTIDKLNEILVPDVPKPESLSRKEAMPKVSKSKKRCKAKSKVFKPLSVDIPIEYHNNNDNDGFSVVYSSSMVTPPATTIQPTKSGLKLKIKRNLVELGTCLETDGQIEQVDSAVDESLLNEVHHVNDGLHMCTDETIVQVDNVKSGLQCNYPTGSDYECISPVESDHEQHDVSGSYDVRHMDMSSFGANLISSLQVAQFEDDNYLSIDSITPTIQSILTPSKVPVPPISPPTSLSRPAPTLATGGPMEPQTLSQYHQASQSYLMYPRSYPGHGYVQNAQNVQNPRRAFHNMYHYQRAHSSHSYSQMAMQFRQGRPRYPYLPRPMVPGPQYATWNGYSYTPPDSYKRGFRRNSAIPQHRDRGMPTCDVSTNRSYKSSNVNSSYATPAHVRRAEFPSSTDVKSIPIIVNKRPQLKPEVELHAAPIVKGSNVVPVPIVSVLHSMSSDMERCLKSAIQRVNVECDQPQDETVDVGPLPDKNDTEEPFDIDILCEQNKDMNKRIESLMDQTSRLPNGRPRCPYLPRPMVPKSQYATWNGYSYTPPDSYKRGFRHNSAIQQRRDRGTPTCDVSTNRSYRSSKVSSSYATPTHVKRAEFAGSTDVESLPIIVNERPQLKPKAELPAAPIVKGSNVVPVPTVSVLNSMSSDMERCSKSAIQGVNVECDQLQDDTNVGPSPNINDTEEPFDILNPPSYKWTLVECDVDQENIVSRRLRMMSFICGLDDAENNTKNLICPNYHVSSNLNAAIEHCISDCFVVSVCHRCSIEELNKEGDLICKFVVWFPTRSLLQNHLQNKHTATFVSLCPVCKIEINSDYQQIVEHITKTHVRTITVKQRESHEHLTPEHEDEEMMFECLDLLYGSANKNTESESTIEVTKYMCMVCDSSKNELFVDFDADTVISHIQLFHCDQDWFPTKQSSKCQVCGKDFGNGWIFAALCCSNCFVNKAKNDNHHNLILLPL